MTLPRTCPSATGRADLGRRDEGPGDRLRRCGSAASRAEAGRKGDRAARDRRRPATRAERRRRRRAGGPWRTCANAVVEQAPGRRARGRPSWASRSRRGTARRRATRGARGPRGRSPAPSVIPVLTPSASGSMSSSSFSDSQERRPTPPGPGDAGPARGDDAPGRPGRASPPAPASRGRRALEWWPGGVEAVRVGVVRVGEAELAGLRVHHARRSAAWLPASPSARVTAASLPLGDEQAR